jgi:hypothetical protein
MEHSKQKGNIGQSATIKEIHKLGLNVFVELGDNSKVDLIVEKNGKLVTIQVKYSTEFEDRVVLPLRKAGPNGYRYSYTENDVDVFSVYLPSADKVIFVPSKLACQNNRMFTIRFKPSKNKQSKGIHLIGEFENLQQILDQTISSR